jgi:hypothetical protein
MNMFFRPWVGAAALFAMTQVRAIMKPLVA